jgi:CRP-like cAMP-binding protein
LAGRITFLEQAMDDRFEALRASPLCSELDDDQCRRLASFTELRELGAGDVLVREGESDPHLYLVVHGAIGVVKNATGDEAVTLHTLTAGDLVGELGFLDDTPHYAAKLAIAPTRILSLDRGQFESLLAKDPVLVYRVMRGIVRITHQAQRRLAMQQSELTNYIYKQHGRY